MNQSIYPVLTLRSKMDKRLREGHHWIYSNEVDTQKSPLSQFTVGEIVRVDNAQGESLGVATLNPHTLICARLMSRESNCTLDREFFVGYLRKALSLREHYFAAPFYRLIYGDSDGLSGLVVDRFGDVLVAQMNTAGMQALSHVIVEALDEVFKPSAILLKNDSLMRELEGLPLDVVDALGQTPELVPIEENGAAFYVPVRQGQKTGWFYDHRINRALLQSQAANKRVLDLFSYVGAWAIESLVAGAQSAVCVDASAQALDWAMQNAEYNKLTDRLQVLQGSAFDVAQQLLDAGERFDVVVVDPPAFIKRRKDVNQGERAYRRINELALRLLNPQGLLVSASCSMHLSRGRMTQLLNAASNRAERPLQIVAQGGQGPDHPIHPAIAETDYLKAVFACTG